MHAWADGWAGFAWMLVFWVAVVGVIYGLLRGLGTPARGPAERRPGPLEILDERFARGEISGEEYAERRQVLQGSVNHR